MRRCLQERRHTSLVVRAPRAFSFYCLFKIIFPPLKFDAVDSEGGSSVRSNGDDRSGSIVCGSVFAYYLLV